MAAEASRSSPSADSYIGSLISLTSKSEIRYEGILYSINSEESTIGLRNVRSFGTEGRRRDGQQLPAGDNIFEFILFRGSDIKDLQVKASPLAQTNPMQHDPAIIQSNYLHPSTASPSLPANLPSFGSISVPELSSNTAQLGLQQPSFQGSLPAHQTGGSFGTWSAIPPPQTIPMYWQGYYAHSQGLSHLQQLPLIRPLPAIAMPPMQQTSQSQGTNALLASVPSNYPEFPPLFPPVSSSLNLASTSISSTVSPIQTTSFTSEMSPFSVSNKIPKTSLPAPIPSLMLLPLPPIASNVETSASFPQNIPSLVNSISRIGPFSSVGNQTETRSTPPIVGLSGSIQLESSDTLVTPDQLKQLTSSASPSSQSLVKVPNEVEVQPPEDRTKALLSERPAPKSEAETKLTSVRKEPILPLPSPAYQLSNAALLHATQTSWGYGRGIGRGRGRGSGYTRPVVKFSEEFDFTAMNEKFNKDKVWGNLGKSRAHSSNTEDDEEADQFDENNAESLKFNIKPVYVKDEFFDTLSCNANEQTNNGRIKFSEQLKIDTETFGNFQLNNSTYGGGRELQHRGGGGGGGGRGRSSYSGRSYGYSARGRDYNRTVEHHKVLSVRDVNEWS